MKSSPTGIVTAPLSRSRPRSDSKPWYRQFWPWFLIVLPASSVVFSFATLYIAVSGADEVLPHEGDSTSYSAPRQPTPLAEALPAAGADRDLADAAAVDVADPEPKIP